MEFEMTYNSQEDLLIISEYGRNVQNLVRHCKTIEDDKDRQQFAEQLVELMYQMNPQSKNVLEYKAKLWKHLFKIAEYDINVTPPNLPIPTVIEDELKPEKLEYPVKEREFRHYGHNVRLLMEKAIGMEEGPIKQEFVEVIGSFMKLAYKNWNREHYVSDEIILEDLHSLSKGKLKVEENRSLDTLTAAVRHKTHRRRPSNSKSNNRGGRRNNNNRNNKNNNKRRR
ncbi:DUF4290 domain-containing protein [Saprospiraceae bacterium]|nr:DUF4290 domain-containing protein [Saprospiraceae bacterium]